MPLRRGSHLVIYSDQQPLVCEICGVAITGATAMSIFCEYPMPGGGNQGQRCLAVQHFYCSHRHALLGTIVCVLFHLQEDTLHAVVPPVTPVTEETHIEQLRIALARFAGVVGT